MGNCFDCLGGTEAAPETPDPEERRRRQEAAALKRQKENESRGLHDPEGVRRKRQKQQEIEKKASEGGRQTDAGLRWTVG